MDIRQNRPATAADTRTTTQTQKSQGDSSLLSRMAVRTMLGDLETIKKKPEPIFPPTNKVASDTVAISAPIIIPAPLSPASLVSSKEAPILAQLAIREKEKERKATEELAEKIETAARKEAEAKLKEEKQKTKEAQRLAQEAIREKEREAEKERKATEELAEKIEKEKKLAEETKNKEAARKIQEERNQNFEKAQADYEASNYETVIELTKKMLTDESLPWFLKFRLNRLVKKAENALQKKQTNQTEEAIKINASLPSSLPPISLQRITHSPPPNLPTLPDPLEKATSPLAQGSLQEKSAPQEESTSISGMGIKTISPLLTELISEDSPEPEEEPSLNFLKNKRALFIGAALALVLLLVSFGWWFANKKPSPVATVSPSRTPTISASPKPSPSVPAPLFAANKQKIIELKNEKQNLREILLALTKTEEPADTFAALAIKNDTGEYLSLNEIAQDLGLEIFSLPTQGCDQNTQNCAEPETIEELLDTTRFSLFIYSQENSSSSIDSSSPFTVTSGESEGRLGLMISLKKENNSTSTQFIENQLLASLKDLETLLPKEFASFLLENPVIPQNPVFLQNYYKNTGIRYLNLPTSKLSMDYAIIDEKLVFATSKESMYAIIDRILSQTETTTD